MYNYRNVIYIITTPYTGCIEMGYADDLADRLHTLNEYVPGFHPYAVYSTDSKNAEHALFAIIDEFIPVVRVESTEEGKIRDRELLRLSPEQGYRLLERIAVISHTENNLHRLLNDGETAYSTVTDDPRTMLEPGHAKWFCWDDDFPVSSVRILQIEIDGIPYNAKNMTEAYRTIHKALYGRYPEAYEYTGKWFSHDGKGMRISYKVGDDGYIETNIRTSTKFKTIESIAKRASLDSSAVRFFVEKI